MLMCLTLCWCFRPLSLCFAWRWREASSDPSNTARCVDEVVKKVEKKKNFAVFNSTKSINFLKASFSSHLVLLGSPVLLDFFALHVLLQVRAAHWASFSLLIVHIAFRLGVCFILKLISVFWCCRNKDGLKGFSFSALKWVGSLSRSPPLVSRECFDRLGNAVPLLSFADLSSGKKRFPLTTPAQTPPARDHLRRERLQQPSAHRP